MLHLIAFMLFLVVAIVVFSAASSLISRGRSTIRAIFEDLKDTYAEAKAQQELRSRARRAIGSLEEIERTLELRSVAATGLDEAYERIASMDGGKFEEFIARTFRALGYDVTRTPSSGDQGVDVLARKDGVKVAIQCKNYARPAGNSPVQQVFAGARFYEADEACVVAPEGYTEGARDAARRCGITLYARRDIRDWIEQVNVADHPSSYMTPTQVYSALLEQHTWYLRRLEDGAWVRLAGGNLPEVGEKYATLQDQIEGKLDTLTSKIEAMESARPIREAARATVIRVKSCATYRQIAAFAHLAASEGLSVGEYSDETANLSVPEADAASREIVLRPRLRVSREKEERARELMELALSSHVHRYPLRLRVEPVVESYDADAEGDADTDGQLAAT